MDYVNFDYKSVYYTEGEKEAEKLWLVLHGYGQLAPYFIRKFDFLENKAFVAAPQGLSSFYLNGTSGRVGASWMTKENRQLAIQNYISYLNHTYIQVVENMKTSPKQVTMLGFSQGVSTLIRWLVTSPINFDQLIMCAGAFPDDIDIETAKKVFMNKPCYYFYGDQDPFIKPESIGLLKTKFHQYGLKVDFRQFEGKHEMPQYLLEQFA